VDDIAITQISRTEYIHSDDHLLAALKRFRGLRSYPAAADRGQRALHDRLMQLAVRGLVRQVGHDGNTVRWQSAV
jgi:hypothetical protein